jgi:uncharacterized membrane protein
MRSSFEISSSGSETLTLFLYTPPFLIILHAGVAASARQVQSSSHYMMQNVHPHPSCSHL